MAGELRYGVSRHLFKNWRKGDEKIKQKTGKAIPGLFEGSERISTGEPVLPSPYTRLHA